MIFKTILPGAWALTQDANYHLFALSVPIAWQQIAKSLASRRAKLRGKGYQAPPVYSLDPLVAASFPRIIKTNRQGWQRPNLPWLLTEERISDLSLLALLIKDWLREEFSASLGESEVEESLSNLNSEDWQWEKQPRAYSLLYPQTKDEESILYNVIPDFLAKEFLRNPRVEFGGQELMFYRVIRLHGAELMSWPPRPITLVNHQGEEERAYVSFVLRFAMQTVPGRESPIMYHHLSVRRWIVNPLARPPYRGLTTYIGNELRLLDGVRQPLCFIPLTMKRQGEVSRWSRVVEQLLADDTRLPNPSALLENPIYHWTEFERTSRPTQAAIAFDSRHAQSSSGAISLPGVSSFDLACIDQAICDRLPLERIGEAVQVGRSVKFLNLPTKSKPKNATQSVENQNQPSKRRKGQRADPNTRSTPMLRPNIAAPAIFRSTKSIQVILIVWETAQCRDALIAEICQLFCLSATGKVSDYTIASHMIGQAQRYEGSFGSLWIKTQHVGDLTKNLDIDRSVPPRDRQQRRVQLLQERIDCITPFLPSAEGVSGALIEIRQKAFPPEADPKLAWRIAAMQAGYLNQHIHALTYQKEGQTKTTKDASERVKHAVLDLLRQCGVLPDAPLIQPSDEIEPHVWLICFYVLRRTRRTTASNLPSTVVMMVRINAIEAKVEVTTPSLLERNRKNPWVAYPSALKHLLSERWEPDSQFENINSEPNDEQTFSEKEKEEALLNKFVSECLQTCLNEEIDGVKPYVLFMAEAQNARRKGLLSWLQNPNLQADKILDVLHLKDTDERNRLWIVRLRLQGSSYETPVAIVKPSPNSRAKSGSRARGVIYRWQDVSKVEYPLYLSLRRSATTEQYPLRISQSRLDDGSRSNINARLLEVAVVHCPGIKPDRLALLVHRLRGRFPYFADDISLPVPFPFAIKAKEYAVSVKDSAELSNFDRNTND